MDTDVESCLKDWNDLASDFKALEALNREYVAKLEELTELQGKCLNGISHQRYRMGVISKSLKQVASGDCQKLRKDMERREEQLHEIEQTLPKANGTYLSIILGSVNVSILNKDEKFKYKDEYEKFKVVLSVIGFILSVINLFTNFRTLELSFMFLLVWYYCTLTIRESILKVNGSRIKGWWRFHHFLSTVVSGVLLVWPNTSPWYAFRGQFMWFNVYISFVQYLQFRYQRGVLYRLKALGERHNMDITIEGFHSWMWRGLSFLLPFLFVGYFFQLYNAYTLYHLMSHPEATWHVPVLSAMFFILFLGNAITTILVIPQKWQDTFRRQLPDVFNFKNDKRKTSQVKNEFTLSQEKNSEGKSQENLQDKKEN
ncbi:transmembrane protein 120 homolog [Fopius arisanus]|uniref:Transmembrane protein 120 homolog n=2 Tax=Fopius arisanus TaxID=64838 RepID=A0A9R1TBU1_9HYME|nr:PREDICTED: transmembrane protein 120 homolog [Fopius arisanus]XP_011306304.1 PREDICTED: transmembrane protein 120 homolog [Fopius arisanus]XP_011306305.1 PREDICTED: transmembrane protein 120 homolog [Fopius arisanus]XP_011306306.1 PREDICTED: transmembrane protein 120 homolog [Fopius arisanus]